MGQEQPVKPKEPEKTLKGISNNYHRTSQRVYQGDWTDAKRFCQRKIQSLIWGEENSEGIEEENWEEGISSILYI